MSPDEQALLQAVRDSPEDDLPRLAYADWLEETGDPARLARAEFIRVQVEKARLDEFDGRREGLTDREQRLLLRFGDAWRGRLAGIVNHPSHVFFHRGFPEPWVCGNASDALDRAEPLADDAPTWDFLFTGRGPGCIDRFHASPLLGRVAQIATHPSTFDWPAAVPWDDRDLGHPLARLLSTPRLAALRRLGCHHGVLADEYVAQVAACPALAGLRLLNFSYASLGVGGVRALAGSPHLAGLAEIDLNRTGIGAEGVVAVAAGAWRPRALYLAYNEAGDEGAVALADSPRLGGLERLNLNGNAITDTGLRALTASPHLADLRELRLLDNRYSRAGLEALAGSPHLGRLRILGVSSPGGVRAAEMILRPRFGDALRTQDYREEPF